MPRYVVIYFQWAHKPYIWNHGCRVNGNTSLSYTQKSRETMEAYALTITTAATVSFLILILTPTHCTEIVRNVICSIPQSDVDLLEFPLNLEYLEAEFFLYGSLGYGLDMIAPNLTMGGPSPIGAKKANLSPFIKDIILQFALQEVGHLRAIQDTVKGFPRPLMDLSSASFAKVMDSAFGRPLRPPFDPYASGLNFLLASYLVPYVGLTGYVGANPKLIAPISKKVFSLLVSPGVAIPDEDEHNLLSGKDMRLHPVSGICRSVGEACKLILTFFR